MLYLLADVWNYTADNGLSKRYVKGDPLEDLPSQEIDRLVHLEMAGEENPLTIKPQEDETFTEIIKEVEEKEPPKLPAKSAPLKEWQEVAKQYDLKVQGKKRADLIAELYALLNI